MAILCDKSAIFYILKPFLNLVINNMQNKFAQDTGNANNNDDKLQLQ